VKPDYYSAVYDIIRTIPPGRVSTYGAIADFLTLGSARMVGYALRQLPASMEDVPAHRVVNSQGDLTGRHRFNPPGLMQALLESEGVNVKNDRVINFRTLFWHPQEL
jgi:methylated-DNA-protein-cysteine methyltransferase-like protein